MLHALLYQAPRHPWIRIAVFFALLLTSVLPYSHVRVWAGPDSEIEAATEDSTAAPSGTITNVSVTSQEEAREVANRLKARIAELAESEGRPLSDYQVEVVHLAGEGGQPHPMTFANVTLITMLKELGINVTG